MKILVTGGCGFIGSNFIHYLLETYPQDSIINVDKLTYVCDLYAETGVSIERTGQDT